MIIYVYTSQLGNYLTLYILISPCIFSVLISLIILIMIMIIIIIIIIIIRIYLVIVMMMMTMIIIMIMSFHYFGTYQKARLKMNKLKVC